MNPTTLKILLAGVAGTTIGSTATYILTNRHLTTKYSKIAEDEIEQAKLFYKKLHKQDEFSSLETLNDYEEDTKTLTEVTQALGRYDYTKAGENAEEVESELKERVKRIFTGPVNTEEFDYEAEIDKRVENPDKPYIISYDEFNENPPEHTQTTLSFFEGDGVLCDASDETVDDVDGHVGEDNLLRFGYGSKDNNVVYIRTEPLGHDFEVIRHTGRYAEIVLGFIQHEEKRGPRRMRRER